MRLRKEIIIGLSLVAFFGFIFFRNSFTNRPLRETLQTLEQKNFSVAKENEELRNRIENFSSAEGIEKEIKQDLNLARPGESIIVFKNNETSTEATNGITPKKNLSYYIFKTKEVLKTILKTIYEN